jgi:hypothetical protein
LDIFLLGAGEILDHGLKGGQRLGVLFRVGLEAGAARRLFVAHHGPVDGQGLGQFGVGAGAVMLPVEVDAQADGQHGHGHTAVNDALAAVLGEILHRLRHFRGEAVLFERLASDAIHESPLFAAVSLLSYGMMAGDDGDSPSGCTQAAIIAGPPGGRMCR